MPVGKVNDDRLYRALDALLPHKDELEKHLKDRLGELFEIEYDLLLYDVTSTYFEGLAESNEQAKRGYSRDHRGDCKQVCIALVVSKCGMPLAYEVFDGNRHDSTTVEEIVTSIESKYGSADRIWVMDRGMTSEENIEFLKENGQRYILGTPKSALKTFESKLLEQGWDTVHEGLEVKLCPCPDGAETFILCRSAQRREKEKAMHERFEKKIEAGLTKIAAGCAKKRQKPIAVARRVGKLLGCKHPRGRSIRCRCKGRRWSRGSGLVKGRCLARLVEPERGMLSAAQQHHGLDRRGTLESLHPAHSSRGCFSHSQERSVDPPDMASEERAGSGAHSGVLPCICPLEDPRTDVPGSGSGR